MNTILKNSFALLTSQVATIIAASVTLLVLPGYFGDETYGNYRFAATYLGLFTLIGLAGTGTYMVKTIARTPDSARDLAWNAAVMKFVLGVLLSVVALSPGAILGFDRETMIFVLAAALLMIGGLLTEVTGSALQGLEMMARPAAWAAFAQYCMVGLFVVGVLMDLEPTVIVFLGVPALFIPVAANALILRRDAPIGVAPILRWTTWVGLTLGGLPFLVYNGVRYLYGSADMLMLRPLADSATVGWYALAYRWVGLPVVLAGTVMLALFPALSVHGVSDRQRFASLVNRALKFVAFISFPLAAGIFAVAGVAVQQFYGESFEQSAILIRILALQMPIVVFDMVIGLAFFATDRQRTWIAIGLVAALLNPLLNFIAIPLTIEWFDNGAIGAAVVTGLTELLILGCGLALRPEGVFDRHVMLYLLRCGVAGVMVAVVALALEPLGLVAMVFGGGGTFVAMAALLRIVPRAELSQLIGRVRKRSGDTGRTEEPPDPAPTGDQERHDEQPVDR